MLAMHSMSTESRRSTEPPAHALAALGQRRGAFAAVEALPDGRQLLAVDRFARESLCWTLRDGRLLVAKRATDLADAATPLDAQAIFDYLYFHVIPSPRTVFQGIYRLPAGHCLVADGHSVTVAPYWQPRFKPTSSKPDFEGLKVEFLELLRQATVRELDGGVAACFLSGGTDSSTVAGMIAESTGKAPRAYSIGFEADGYDEMAYARVAAKRFGAEHREYYVTPDDLVRGIPAVAAHYDQPFGNSSALPAYYCAKMAHDEGVTRLLAGDGGDELFGGNERYAKQQVFSHYGRAPSWLAAAGDALLLNSVADALPIARKAGSYIRQAKVPLPDRLQTYNLLTRLGVNEVFTPGFLAQVNVQGPIEQQRAVWGQAESADVLNRQLAFDWRYTLAENDLPKVCGTAALAGVSVGFPLLDEALLDFSLRLPVDYKLRGTRLRWFFKEALRGFLPDEIIAKQKHGFGLPFGVWMRRHESLSALASESLRSLADRGLVRIAFVQRLLDQHTAQHAGYFGEMVWVLMMLEQWLRAHRPDYQVRH
jgi:asparagine synthase (glutamine-hydrolysing)